MHTLFQEADIASILDFSKKMTAKLAENHDIHLKHGKFLNDMAQINGFRNWASMKSSKEGLCDSLNEGLTQDLIMRTGTPEEIFDYLECFTECISKHCSSNSMWHLRAMVLLKAGLATYCEYRDAGKSAPTMSELRKYILLDWLVSAMMDDELSSDVRNRVGNYLRDLPGFSDEDAYLGNLCSKTWEQHSHQTMQLTPIFDILDASKDEYIVIYKDKYSETSNRHIVGSTVSIVALPGIQIDNKERFKLANAIVSDSILIIKDLQKAEGEAVKFIVLLDDYGYEGQRCTVTSYDRGF